MTILKRNLCDINGNVFMEDISIDDVLPDITKVNIMVEFIEHGLMEGYAWIEERYVTKLPWILVLLCFWFISPKVEKTIFIHLEHEGTVIDFDVPLDTTKDLRENLQSVGNTITGIRDLWITNI